MFTQFIPADVAMLLHQRVTVATAFVYTRFQAARPVTDATFRLFEFRPSMWAGGDFEACEFFIWLCTFSGMKFLNFTWRAVAS